MSKKELYFKAPNGEIFTSSNAEWHKDCEQLSNAAGKLAHKEYTRKALIKMIKPGQTIYTLTRSVSSSGMSRKISLFVVHRGGVNRHHP